MKRLVYVTGAGRGIGKAIALRLAREGYEVAGCSRTRAELERTRDESEQRVRIATVDVTDFTAVTDWLMREEEASGAQPWGLVTAAGIYGGIGPFVESSWEEWRRGIEVNLYGTALAVKAFASRLLELRLKGRILLLSGGGATQPIPNFSSYCAAKSAVVRFGETVAHELKPYGITVNSLAPGAINTKFNDEIIQAGPEKAGRPMFEKALQQKETGGQSPDKVAALAAYLLEDRTGFVTGRLISAVWDPWEKFEESDPAMRDEKTYTLRRLVPEV